MTDIWVTLVPYAKLLCIFTCMLLGVRFKLGLGFSALLGSFILALFFGLTPWNWLQLAADIFSDRSILTVWGVIILVLGLSSLMERTGQAERFMAAFAKKISSPVFRLIFFPVLIGLLPMPGGAVFSAPMINAVARKLDVPNEDKSLINYWFRHCAEMCWPLFPALILASGMAGMSTPQLVAWSAPLSAVFLFTGWLFFVRPLRIPETPPADVAAEEANDNEEKASWGRILYHGAPIFTALAGALFFEVIFAYFLPSRPMDEGVLIALALAVGLCLMQNKLGIIDLLKTLWQPEVRNMIIIVGALGVFKNVLVGGNVVNALISQGAGMATLWITATVLPFVVSALTGLMMACVGSIFPLLVVLVQHLDGGAHMAQWLTLGLACGISGAIFSPLHICFVLSCEYFNVDLVHSWRRLPLPSFFFMACSLLYFWCIVRL